MQKIWITRSSHDAIIDNIIISKKKPKTIKGFFTKIKIEESDNAIFFESQEFYNIFGYMPKKGTCEKKEIILRNIEK